MKKILIADDDSAICESLAMMLEDEEYEVATTINGRTVQEVKENLPDLILLDIWMSGMDGRKICKHLKSQKATKHIPIVMISANKDAERLAKEAGADDFLAKPFEMDHVLAKIELHINTRT